MVLFALILSSIIIGLTYIYWYQTRSRYAKLVNSFPRHEKFLPVFGSVLAFSREPDVLFKQLRELLSSFTETTSAWFGTHAAVHIITAEDAEIILSSPKHLDKGFFYKFLHQWLDTGLLTSTGAKWHQRRRMLTPAFHYNILQMFVEIFGEKSYKLTESLKSECDKSKTDIFPYITQTTLAAICETSMGIQLQENDENQKKYSESLHALGDFMISRAFSPWIHADVAYYFTPMYWKQKSLTKLLHKFTNNIIQKRFGTFQDSDVENLESNEEKPKKRLAMLDLLIYENRCTGKIDLEGIREEVDTFVFEGHDTTTIALCAALTVLANHWEIQEKIKAEMDEIFGDSDRHATYEDLQNMKYLECCLKESLRLYPSVPLIMRRNREDIPLTKHTIPAGTEVFVHIYNIHRDPKYYPDPEKFDPDRFLPENCVGRHPYTYIPFSAGPRNCIGQKFAMLELKSIVSSILRNFILEPIDEPKNLRWVVDLVLRVKGPIYVKFKSRSQAESTS